MSKPLKNKKNRVPKITEAEYTQYLTSLKSSEEKGESPVKVPSDTSKCVGQTQN